MGVKVLLEFEDFRITDTEVEVLGEGKGSWSDGSWDDSGCGSLCCCCYLWCNCLHSCSLSKVLDDTHGLRTEVAIGWIYTGCSLEACKSNLGFEAIVGRFMTRRAITYR